MRTFLLITCCCLLSAARSAMAAPRPNIILCMADDMGWGDPGYNSATVTYADGTAHPDQGWIRTPNLDTMAASGLRFTRFYAASAVCSPTRASCLTGRNPFRVGVPDANVGRLGFAETPLSKVLSAQGYRCGHFGKWHLGSLTTLRADSNRGGDASVYAAPWHHGYDTCFVTESKVPTYHPYRKASNSAALPTSFADPNFYGARYWRMPATWNPTSGEGDAVPVGEINNPANGDDSKLLVDQVIPFIRSSVAESKPFFVVLWFHTPHQPIVDPDGISGVDSSDALRNAIEDLDLAIGRVRTELATLGVRGNTMLWLTSDNGPEDGDNSPNETSTVRSLRSGRFLMRKRSLNDGGLRVPGILEWPDVITSHMTSDLPAVTSDYYPTILDYLELAVPDQKPLDGISLRPVIEGTASVRTKPIGFKYGSQNSWLNQQYKLIENGSGSGSGWQLFDMLNIQPGQEAEQTPVATAANIGSRPAEIRDVYNTMMAEFNAWNASVANDTPYVHASQPTLTLTTPVNPVSGPFSVTATFSEPISQLHAGEFAVTNGTASALTGGGTSWTITVSPTAPGPVAIQLPEGAVIDPDGNPNAASNRLDVNTPPSGVGTPVSVHSTLPLGWFQTVDSAGGVPGAGSNNLLKFTAGTVNDGVANPFTTTLYVRSSTGSAEDAMRRVRACVKFDLSALQGQPVRSASLDFKGHSLNAIPSNDVNLQVVALGSPWSPSGAPLPTFNPSTLGLPTAGERIESGLAPADHTRDYRVDVTTAVRNWLSGSWPNHGFQIRLDNLAINNGVGIRTTGEGAVRLLVEQAPLQLTGFASGPGEDDLTISWNSATGVSYRVEASGNLLDWQPVQTVAGAPGGITTFTAAGGRSGFHPRFYRIAWP